MKRSKLNIEQGRRIIASAEKTLARHALEGRTPENDVGLAEIARNVEKMRRIVEESRP